MPGLEEVRRKLLTAIVEIDRNQGLKLTGEKNLILSKQELIEKVIEYDEAYLDVIEWEALFLVEQGLFLGYREGNGTYFKIPDWDLFITAVHNFYVCYK